MKYRYNWKREVFEKIEEAEQQHFHYYKLFIEYTWKNQPEDVERILNYMAEKEQEISLWKELLEAQEIPSSEEIRKLSSAPDDPEEVELDDIPQPGEPTIDLIRAEVTELFPPQPKPSKILRKLGVR